MVAALLALRRFRSKAEFSWSIGAAGIVANIRSLFLPCYGLALAIAGKRGSRETATLETLLLLPELRPTRPPDLPPPHWASNITSTIQAVITRFRWAR